MLAHRTTHSWLLVCYFKVKKNFDFMDKYGDKIPYYFCGMIEKCLEDLKPGHEEE